MKIGVIADDFTGATDAASFIVRGGLSAIQLSGVPTAAFEHEADALVVSLKSRSCPVEEAVRESVNACHWLLAQGCELIYFKYCSTFDSTSKGNIGPVTKALMDVLCVDRVLYCPSLPVNGRTVYQGHLFVFEQLLSESGMKNHPITPMTDSNLVRLVEQQTKGKAGLIDLHVVSNGQLFVETHIQNLSDNGTQHIVCDAISDRDLEVIARVGRSHRLVTGGSGLVGAIAHICAQEANSTMTNGGSNSLANTYNKGIVLSGSCSEMTNKQVTDYVDKTESLKLDIDRTVSDESYIDNVLTWVLNHSDKRYFPMVYATVEPRELAQIQSTYGEQASVMVEALFEKLVKNLKVKGYNTFISAGGETSGTVTQALKVNAFHVGQEIAPGVPWMQSLDGDLKLALKSGNFGDKGFFSKAQELLNE
ncbi:3-oxo-tetronate kinase [Vibrio sonorensis]|uniref:3-oxo-tetronate kinase n=1 Tax=Vibrio sonorensis TaxID=1004316 RepID=UPI0008DA8A99|nr:3-oxo-tetronate kinase [Vibrio sonorensis]